MCMIDWDLEPCSVWVNTVVLARKEHECNCCGGSIRVGKPYTRHFSVADGAVTAEKMCAACSLMCERFLAEHGQISTPSYMMQLLYDCYDDDHDEGKRWLLETLNMERRRKARKRRLAAAVAVSA